MASTFLGAPKFGAISLPFGARSFSMAEMWRCLPWEEAVPSVFFRYSLPVSAAPGASGGNGFLNGFSKYFSSYLKAKVIYVTPFESFWNIF